MGLVRHAPMPGEDEPLHAYITGATQEMVSKAAEKVSIFLHRTLRLREQTTFFHMLCFRFKK